MKKNYLKHALALLCLGGLNHFTVSAQCLSCGTGSNGAYLASANTTLAGGTYNYTTFTINAGDTVKVTGTTPLMINCTGNVVINGILMANGGNGGNGVTFTGPGTAGLGVAGGADGGVGVFSTNSNLPGVVGSGPGAGSQGLTWSGGGGAGYATAGTHDTMAVANGGPAYGNAWLHPLYEGSGGGSGSGGFNCGSGGGGGGGGLIQIASCGSITIGASGSIQTNGGNGGSDGNGNCGGGGGGSGGTIWLSGTTLVNNGMLMSKGGLGGTSSQTPAPNGIAGKGASGRIRIDCPTVTGTGTIVPASGFTATAPAVSYTQNPSNVCSNAAAFTLSSATPTGGAYSGTGVSGTSFDPSVSGIGTFTVTYTVTDTNTCTASAGQTITVSSCTGIRNLNPNGTEAMVYPNPFTDKVTLIFEGSPAEHQLRIINMLGKTISTFRTSEANLELDLSTLEKGTYFIEIQTGNEKQVKPIIKQ